MNRSLSFALLLIVPLAPALVASPADAQVIGTDLSGFPIQQIGIGSLGGGRRLQIRAMNLQAIPAGDGLAATTPDSIINLETDTGGQVQYADGCNLNDGTGFTWIQSCMDVTMSTTQVHRLWLWAWGSNANSGVAEIKIRWENAAGSAGGNPSFTSASGWGSWISIGNFTFGGQRVQVNVGTSTAEIRWQTGFLFGDNQAHAMIVQRDPGYGIVASLHQQSTSGYREYYTPNRSAAGVTGLINVYFGPKSSAGWGPSRLMQNDGPDLDGDGLSYYLEGSLGTCDSAGQTTGASSFVCNRLRGCGSTSDVLGENLTYDAAVCQKSLEDTDHDGLPEHAEVLGNDVWNQLARYGASPAHADLFVEVDGEDHDRGASGCQGFSTATAQTRMNPAFSGFMTNESNPKETGATIVGPAPRSFFDLTRDTFAGYPASLNPDGAPGVRLHFDVNVTNPLRYTGAGFSRANPDTRFGAWGGSGCQTTCAAAAEPTPEAPNTCWPGVYPIFKIFSNEPWNTNDSTCSNTVCSPTTTMTPERKWSFVYLFDVLFEGGVAEASTMAPFGSTVSVVHELGHILRLEHNAPSWSVYDRTDIPCDHRPTHLSRINYRYQEIGGKNGEDQDFPGLDEWSLVSFSAGHPTAVTNTRAMREACPFPQSSIGHTDLRALENDDFAGDGPQAPIQVQEACANPQGCTLCDAVDFNGDGSFDPPGGPDREFKSWQEHSYRRKARSSDLSLLNETPIGNADIAIVGATEIVAAPVCSGSCSVRLWAEHDQDCRIFPVDPRAAGFESTGGYPPCFRVGTAQPVSGTGSVANVALASGRVWNGSAFEDGALLLVRTGSGSLGWHTVRLGAIGGAVERALTVSAQLGTISSTAVGAPGAVRDGSEVYAGYVSAGGVMVTRYQDNQTSWAPAAAVQVNGSALLAAAVGVDFVRHDSDNNSGTPDDLIAVTIDTTGNPHLYRVVPATGLRTTWVDLGAVTGGLNVIRAPRLVSVPTANNGPPGRRLYVYWVHSANQQLWRSFVEPGQSLLGPWTHDVQRGGSESALNPQTLAPGIEYDARSSDPRVRGTRLAFREYSNLLRMAPFATEAEPGVYPEPSEWVGIFYGLCHHGWTQRAGASSPYTTSGLAADRVCGPVPRYPVPTEFQSAPIGPFPAQDSAANPWLYVMPPTPIEAWNP